MDFLKLKISEQLIDCPKHGKHKHYISSTIEGHKGHWCMICWLESLGEPLQLIDSPID